MDPQILGIIVGIPSALIALIALGVMLRRILRRDEASQDEHVPDAVETTHRVEITVDQPRAPGREIEASYWAGRPESLGDKFYGRDDELGAIATSFKGSRAVVISGGAGSGKSRLAAEYAHSAKVNGFWTAGETDIASTLAGLAPSLGIDVGGKSDDEIAVEVQRGLASLSSENLWVVDNLPNMEQVNELLNESGSARLLIATRDSRRHLLPPRVAYHWIEVLGPDAATALLCSRSKASPDDPKIALIADRVGRLPLALEVLAARLGEPRQSPERVLEQLDQAPTVLQMEAFKKALGATIPRAEGVFASIRGTLDSLGEQDREALSGPDVRGHLAWLRLRSLRD
ncbi:MAG: ATP-binding protein [Chloroflexi bacterium]|nr:ATP-binding protein [Chloroflexota bacterium]